MPPPPPPPPPPPQHTTGDHHHLLKKPLTSLSDFIFTAFSLFILFSSSSKAYNNNLFYKFPPPISFRQNPRRFIRNPIIMSQSNRRNRNNHFASPQSLSDWLEPRLPSDSFASWGVKPGTKNVHNLWLELSEGETLLADSTPPVRTVEVVIVRVIGKDGRILIESHQELSDGTVRSRSRPLSEKMKPGETVESAISRAVKEELGSIIGSSIGSLEDSGIVRIVPNSYNKKVEERASASYPGLPACYVLHSVDALVDGLPDGEFCTEEEEYLYEESDKKEVAEMAVSCKKHHWKWVDPELV